MNRHAIVCYALISSVAVSEKLQLRPTPLPLPFKLDGDGHACAGYLHVTPDLFVWKGSFSLCRTAIWQSFREGKSWVFVLHGKEISEERCGMPIIQMQHPEDMPHIWQVTGYRSLGEMRQNPPNPELSCELM